MPQGDKRGPLGLGPRTGRGLGFCNGYSVPGFMNQGFGRRMGRGFGWRRMAMPIAPVEQIIPVQQEPTKEQEKQLLQQELQNIEAETKEIEAETKEILKRLKELK